MLVYFFQRDLNQGLVRPLLVPINSEEVQQLWTLKINNLYISNDLPQLTSEGGKDDCNTKIILYFLLEDLHGFLFGFQNWLIFYDWLHILEYLI